MTNKDKAIALINTFATGDTEAAKNLLAEGYIQHNLALQMGFPVWELLWPLLPSRVSR